MSLWIMNSLGVAFVVWRIVADAGTMMQSEIGELERNKGSWLHENKFIGDIYSLTLEIITVYQLAYPRPSIAKPDQGPFFHSFS
jgi:hypothetical protein